VATVVVVVVLVVLELPPLLPPPLLAAPATAKARIIPKVALPSIQPVTPKGISINKTNKRRDNFDMRFQ
jgi:hypothetical protein